MSDLDKLIAAVEAGDEDFLIGDDWIDAWGVVAPQMQTYRLRSDGASASEISGRAYHGSLDAALRLHEALLPGWWYRLTKGKHGPEAIVQGDLFAGEHAEASAENTSRAWLLAILRALKAREAA